MAPQVVSHRIEFDRTVMDRYLKLYSGKSLWSTMNALIKAFVEESEKDPTEARQKRAASTVINQP